MEKFFFVFATLSLYLPCSNQTDSVKTFHLGDSTEFTFLININKQEVNITFEGADIIYDVIDTFKFFVPDVNIICQCSCKETKDLFCELYDKCLELTNSTTTCTNYRKLGMDSNVCPIYSLICCQTYFSKSKTPKSFTVLQIKYQKTLVKLNIVSKSLTNEIKNDSLIFNENMKHISVSPDIMLKIHDFSSLPLIPDNWYFIEDGSTELLFSINLNEKDKTDLNKIGWFQYRESEKKPLRIQEWNLNELLEVTLENCHSNPPTYEWKLDTTYYQKREVLHLAKNNEKLSEKYSKSISNIVTDIDKKIIKAELMKAPNITIEFSTVFDLPFSFISKIREKTLYLEFTKGNGHFNGELLSPYCRDKYQFEVHTTNATTKTMKLIPKYYDICWVCLYQNNVQLCQSPIIEEDENSKRGNSSDNEFYPNSSLEKRNQSSEIYISVAIIIVIIFLVAYALYLFLKRKQNKRKERKELIEDIRLENFERTDLLAPPSKSQTKKKEEIYKDFEKIAVKQREKYVAIKFTDTPWTDAIQKSIEIAIDLEVFENIRGQEKFKEQSKLLEDLFLLVDGKEPYRILIEGDQRSGKTNLCMHLLQDWAENKDYLTKKFKMVFMLELKNFKYNTSIYDMLENECEFLDIDGSDGVKCIKQFQKETLLILDGFDELDHEGKYKFLPLLLQKIYPSMFVIVTSRIGIFKSEKAEQQHRICKTNPEYISGIHFWHKRILAKGVKEEQIKTFMTDYFEQTSEKVTNEFKEMLSCPLYFMMANVISKERTLKNINSTTSLYVEFFNFLLRTFLLTEDLINPTEECTIFNLPYCQIVQALVQIGRAITKCLINNNFILEENIFDNSTGQVFLKLGLLEKIKKFHHKEEYFYKPLHKSFLEFVAAFAMWKSFKTDEDNFKEEIKHLKNEGLKASNDCLFFVFLGGLMNSKAHVLFQCLVPYSLRFNIESICFTNILLEIEDIDTFFSSFKSMLKSFVPAIYSIDQLQGVNKDFFKSRIFSLIINYANEQNLIKFLWLDFNVSFSSNLEIYVGDLHLFITNDISNFPLGENKNIKCRTVRCSFSANFNQNNWAYVVTLINSIEFKNFDFVLESTEKNTNSNLLKLLYNELFKGHWEHLNIHQLNYYLNKSNEQNSVNLFKTLIEKRRINGGMNLRINKSVGNSIFQNRLLKNEIETFFNSVIKSDCIKEFHIRNDDSNFSPQLLFPQFSSPIIKTHHWKLFFLVGSLTLIFSNDIDEVAYSVEEMVVDTPNDRKDLHLIRRIQGIKYLNSSVKSFNYLVENKWPGLQAIEELELLDNNDLKPKHTISLSNLSNLRVLAFEFCDVEQIPSESHKESFINLFASLNLKVCEYILMENVDIFSFFSEVLMEGLKRKKENENSCENDDFTVESNREKKCQLDELAISFNTFNIDLKVLNDSIAIQCIKRKLQENLLKQFCWVNRYKTNIKSDEIFTLFPPIENFKSFHEINGMNEVNSRRSNMNFRWYEMHDRFCIEYEK